MWPLLGSSVSNLLGVTAVSRNVGGLDRGSLIGGPYRCQDHFQVHGAGPGPGFCFDTSVGKI